MCCIKAGCGKVLRAIDQKFVLAIEGQTRRNSFLDSLSLILSVIGLLVQPMSADVPYAI